MVLTSLRNCNEKTAKECSEFLAQQLFVVMSKAACSKTVKLFLQGCQSSWLKMRIAESMLDNFDKVLIPQKYRPYSEKTLSLMKIVSSNKTKNHCTYSTTTNSSEIRYSTNTCINKYLFFISYQNLFNILGLFLLFLAPKVSPKDYS